MRILRGVGSLSLPCGCLVGYYETYGGQTLAIIDVRAPGCRDPIHRAGERIDLKPAQPETPLVNRKL
jgi:hypothetical protein